MFSCFYLVESVEVLYLWKIFGIEMEKARNLFVRVCVCMQCSPVNIHAIESSVGLKLTDARCMMNIYTCKKKNMCVEES